MLVLLAVFILANSFFVNAETQHEGLEMKLAASTIEAETPHEGLEMKLAASTIEAGKPHEVKERKHLSTFMAVISNVGYKCDAYSNCDGIQKCCSTCASWRCCPYANGNCCVGGTNCCPPGKYCTTDLQCI